MNKTISISLRVSECELNKIKYASKLEAYSTYSEFIRRTTLLKADEVIKEKELKEDSYEISKS